MKFVVIIELIIFNSVYGIHNFSAENIFIPRNALEVLSQLDDNYFQNVVKFSIENFDRIERLESNIIQARVTVKNGSLSHGIYLETFPNSQAKREDIIARKILASTLHILHSKCIEITVSKQDCINYLNSVPLPESELRKQCLSITRESKYHSFRRLLTLNYKDKLYSMNAKLPKPSKITKLILNFGNLENMTEDKKNLILVQWAQFIEHDLSKPVAASMKDGSAIECCNDDNYKLAPRHIHPVCAALEGITINAYGRTPCINYVRSVLAVNKQCHFGSAEQYNQATAVLDLSQVYGHTTEMRKNLRAGKNGEIKFSSTTGKSLLPTVEGKEKEIFCVLDSNSNDDDCFMAGDTRVNSNPFVTVLYTIFLRSHNEMAKQLKIKNPNWSDETLYNEARRMNIKIYRNIVYKEWLPVVLGGDITRLINNEPLYKTDSREFGISNEFGVAAIRFYYSMLPDVLHPKSKNIYEEENFINSEQNVFALKDQFYKSDLLSNPEKMDVILNGMLQQKAMKMDANYAESITKHFLKAKSTNAVTGADAFAFDVQRGRDHGLQGYVKYLENCEDVKINEWNDLIYYMKSDDIERLKSIYDDLMDIDLIVGGVSETPKSGSTVGPTFTCILAEQFSNIRLLQFNLENDSVEDSSKEESTCSAAKLMCETTDLDKVPMNVFLTPSDINEMVSCDELLKRNYI